MSQAGGASSEQMGSAGGRSLGAGLRCVRRRSLRSLRSARPTAAGEKREI